MKIKFREFWRRLMNSEDDKPVTVTAILMRDSCSRLLGQFSDNNLEECRELLLIWREKSGLVHVAISDSTDILVGRSLIGIAGEMIAENEDGAD